MGYLIWFYWLWSTDRDRN